MDILHFLNYWILGIFDFFVILTLKLVNIFGFLNFWIFRHPALGACEYVWIFEFLNFWIFRCPALGAGEHGEIFEFLTFSSSCPWSWRTWLDYWILTLSSSCPWSWITWLDYWIFDFFAKSPHNSPLLFIGIFSLCSLPMVWIIFSVQIFESVRNVPSS